MRIFNEEGVAEKDVSIQRSSMPTALAWHPAGRHLATGWENGEVVIWSQGGKQIHECQTLHGAAVQKLTWSNSGGLLASGDDDGRVGIWKSNPKNGKVSLIQENKKQMVCVSPTFSALWFFTTRGIRIYSYIYSYSDSPYT